ncbi:unnamed protein product [Protopolystoma xenopodis]|uniref:PH domain-containing protein n=1 Tax=Protopolystoma xenopodis TaxID=117903 RepID=A0A3S5FGA0_9PLAT|nr:unnamed protein product [Protopolystoma xenopodis]
MLVEVVVIELLSTITRTVECTMFCPTNIFAPPDFHTIPLSIYFQIRPLTRYLPVPDDITFDLRHHLAFVCGHPLTAQPIVQMINVNPQYCTGYLWKRVGYTSRQTMQTFASGQNTNLHQHHQQHRQPEDAGKIQATRRSRSMGKSGRLKTTRSPTPSELTSTMTTRSSTDVNTLPVLEGGDPASATREPTVNRSGAGGTSILESALQFLRRPLWRKRWFVLDRKRRLFSYYANRTAATCSPANKPKGTW